MSISWSVIPSRQENSSAKHYPLITAPQSFSIMDSKIPEKRTDEIQREPSNQLGQVLSNDGEPETSPARGLHRTFKARHIQMITLGEWPLLTHDGNSSDNTHRRLYR